MDPRTKSLISLKFTVTFIIFTNFFLQNKHYYAIANEINQNQNGSDHYPLPSPSSSDANATLVAKQFQNQLLQMFQKYKQFNNANAFNATATIYRRHQPRQTFFDYFDDTDGDDVNSLDKKDNGRKPEEQDGKHGTKKIPSKMKETDYYAISSSSSSRSGKNRKHQSDHNGIINGLDTDSEHERGVGVGSGAKRVLTIIKSSSAILPIFIDNQTLHSKDRPTVNFEINSDNIMLTYLFEVDKDFKESDQYFISVVAEKMNCKINTKNETATPKLYIRGSDHELSFCEKFDNSLNGYQSVVYLTSGDKFVTIRGTGDWTNTSASLVASVYTEASHCHYCPEDHFCCGRGDSACKLSMMMNSGKNQEKGSSLPAPPIFSQEYSVSGQKSQKARCIPKQDGSGQSLICNGHPNCGFHCNLDELTVSCPKDDDDNSGGGNSDGGDCPGYYCRDDQQDRFLITVLLLILFCVFVPFCIFLFFCSRRELGREFGRRGRCPLPLEIVFCPFSINADDPDGNGSRSHQASASGTSGSRGAAEGRVRGNVRRGIRRAEEVNSGRDISVSAGVGNPGFFDDLPPPYSECCHNKVTFPNPPPREYSNNSPPPPPAIIRSNTNANTRNYNKDRETPVSRTLRSAFQLQPVMAVPPDIHRRTELGPVVSSPSSSRSGGQNQTTMTTSLSTEPKLSQVDEVTATSTANEN